MPPLLLGLISIWFAVICGILQGAVLGLFFHQADWLGGYAGWRRRLLRLGHIAWFGIALLHGLALLSLQSFDLSIPLLLPICGIVANLGMPLVCLLAAWRQPWRHAFVLPVVATLALAGITLWELLTCVSPASP